MDTYILIMDIVVFIAIVYFLIKKIKRRKTKLPVADDLEPNSIADLTYQAETLLRVYGKDDEGYKKKAKELQRKRKQITIMPSGDRSGFDDGGSDLILGDKDE